MSIFSRRKFVFNDNVIIPEQDLYKWKAYIVFIILGYFPANALNLILLW